MALATPMATGLTYVGIAKESTKGTGVAPSFYLPVSTDNPFDNQPFLEDKAYRGSMNEFYNLLPGIEFSDYEIGGPVFADAIGWPLAGVYGDASVSTGRATGADGNTTNNQPTISAADAAFTVADVGRSISGTNIPANTTILSVQSATAATMSANATGTASTTVFTIGAVGANRHRFAVTNSVANEGQPVSHTLTDFYGLTSGSQARQYAGMQWYEVGFKFSAEAMFEYTAKALGLVSVTTAKPSQNFTSTLPFPTWMGVVTIGGAVVGYLEAGEWTIKRPVKALGTVNNTQTPYSIFGGLVVVEGKLTFIASDDTELTRYLNNTQPSLDLTVTRGSGATQTTCQLHLATAVYRDAKKNISKDYVTYETNFTGLAQSADAGATGGYSTGYAAVINSLASGTYA